MSNRLIQLSRCNVFCAPSSDYLNNTAYYIEKVDIICYNIMKITFHAPVYDEKTTGGIR